MRLMEERIRRDGVVKGNDVLKVESFLNHQIVESLEKVKSMSEEYGVEFC